MRKSVFVGLLFSCLLYSCIRPPSYSVVPHIVFVSVSSQNVQIPLTEPYSVADTITFSFTDGNGDIGTTGNDSDTSQLCSLPLGDSSILHSKVFNVFVIDSRGNHCVSPFTSGNIPNSGKYKAVSGNILVIESVSTTKCVQPTPTCPQDTVIYSVVMEDEAGNLSNTIQAVPIYINSNN